MADPLDLQIQRELARLSGGRSSLAKFRDWFLPVSINIEESGNSSAIALVYQIDGILAEASSAGWDEEAIKEELARVSGAFPSKTERDGPHVFAKTQEIDLQFGVRRASKEYPDPEIPLAGVVQVDRLAYQV
jgi:hypothetical protein